MSFQFDPLQKIDCRSVFKVCSVWHSYRHQIVDIFFWAVRTIVPKRIESPGARHLWLVASRTRQWLGRWKRFDVPLESRKITFKKHQQWNINNQTANWNINSQLKHLGCWAMSWYFLRADVARYPAASCVPGRLLVPCFFCGAVVGPVAKILFLGVARAHS